MGRVRRKLALAGSEARAATADTTLECALCGRPLGERIEWHHVVPKSRGGTDTVPVHTICHRTIHATLTNTELARYADMTVLAQHPAIATFIAWVTDKPTDFHAPTRRARS
jgi:5-methylcytosine-specific restriction endonuclease McrA